MWWARLESPQNGRQDAATPFRKVATVINQSESVCMCYHIPWKSWLFRFLLISLASVGSACSPRRAAESLISGNHFVRTADIAYGADPRQRLDVYRPRAVREHHPVVVFLYGGRWQSGSKTDYRVLAGALTRHRFVAVIPDYRLYPQVRFPAWVDDGAQAVRWVRDNIGQFGGDPERIVLVGHSAGAHTVALLALDKRYLARVGAASAVRGFVSLAGPVDTTWTDPDVQLLMGPQENWPETYPSRHIDGTEPPILFLHGAGDETVLPHNSTVLAALIQERGGCARAVVYPNVGHVEIVIALAIPWLRIAPVVEDVAAFVRDPESSTCPSGD